MRKAQRSWISVKSLRECLDGLEGDLYLYVSDVYNLNIVTYDLDLMVGHIDITKEKTILFDPNMDGKF